jgi:hypothetical protein
MKIYVPKVLEIVRFDDGSIMWIDQHVLRPEAIGDVEMFRLPEHVKRASGTYLRETMVRRIAELGLEGTAFELVWSDEAVSEKDALVEIGRSRRSPALKRFFGQRRSIDWQGWLGGNRSGALSGEG